MAEGKRKYRLAPGIPDVESPPVPPAGPLPPSPYDVGVRLGELLASFASLASPVPGSSTEHQDRNKIERQFELLDETYEHLFSLPALTDADAIVQGLATVELLDQQDELKDLLQQHQTQQMRHVLLMATGRLIKRTPVNLAMLGRGHLAAELDS